MVRRLLDPLLFTLRVSGFCRPAAAAAAAALVSDGPLYSKLIWRVFQATTAVPCHSTRHNRARISGPENRVLLVLASRFQSADILVLEAAAATTDDPRKHNIRHPKCLFGWSQTCILKVFAVDISKHNVRKPPHLVLDGHPAGWSAAVQISA